MDADDPNVVGITVGNASLSGWQDVKITRGIESCPSSFDIALTELYPGQPTAIDIKPGDPCQVTIGGIQILNGYVDQYIAEIGSDKHDVRIVGRGLCQDLVDCSAEFQTFQLQNTTLQALATKLCAPFGINVFAPDGDSAPVPQFNVILTETPFEIIERVARWANFLVFEDTNGSLLIETVGDVTMASGIVEGQNVQSASVALTRNERYTIMQGVYLSTAFLNDNSVPPVGSANPVIPVIEGATVTDTTFPKRADGQPRYRPLIVLSEQTQNLPALAAQRVQWDMARRVGRSQQVRVTVDSWRDSAGTLWLPNALVPVNIPHLKLVNVTWLIASVTFSRDTRGTTADLLLMPKEAFVPEPEVLQPYDFQLAQEIPNAGAGNIGPVPR